jgi:RNA polymerase sigma-70 factor (ECF subfamily)
MTDNEILESIYENDVAGFTLLADTYADLVYRVVYSILSEVGAQRDIEDCISESFVAFYNNIDDVDLSLGSIRGYLGVIARRRAVNLRYTLRPDDDRVFDEYTVEEMSEALKDAEILPSPELSEFIISQCLKEIAPEGYEENGTVSEETEEFPEEEITEEMPEEEGYEEPSEEVTAEPYREPRVVITEKSSALGRVVKTLFAMVSLVAVIVIAVIAFDKLSVPKYEPPTTTAPTTQAGSFNPLFSAITEGNEKLIESLIANSLLLSQDVLKFAVEYADRISYDSIRRMAEEVKKIYGSTGLDPLLEKAIFGDFTSVAEKLKNKDESEMTQAEKLALFFITSFEEYTGQ